MIEIEVNITATTLVNPGNWDTTAALSGVIDRAITKALSSYGHDINVKVDLGFSEPPPF